MHSLHGAHFNSGTRTRQYTLHALHARLRYSSAVRGYAYVSCGPGKSARGTVARHVSRACPSSCPPSLCACYHACSPSLPPLPTAVAERLERRAVPPWAVLDGPASRGRSRGRLPFSPAMVSEGGESAVRGHVSRGGHGWVARAARDKARASPTITSAGCLRAAALQNPAGHARRTLYYA